MDKYFYCDSCKMYGVLNLLPSITQEEFEKIAVCFCGNRELRYVDSNVVMMNHNLKIINILNMISKEMQDRLR